MPLALAAALALAKGRRGFFIAALAFASVAFGAPASAQKKDSPADLAYRSARETMVRGDHKAAIAQFGKIAERFPQTPHAMAALYYRAFLQYQQYRPGSPSALRSALITIKQLERNYPEAPQRADARALRTRICGELARLGDEACREEVVDAARNIAKTPKGRTTKASGTAAGATLTLDQSPLMRPDSSCANDRDVDNAIVTLSSLWKVDSIQAANMTANLLALKNPCYNRLRQQAVVLLLQRPRTASGMRITMFDAARNDPDPGVRKLSTLWLLNQEWEPDVAVFLKTTFGQPFRVKAR